MFSCSYTTAVFFYLKCKFKKKLLIKDFYDAIVHLVSRTKSKSAHVFLEKNKNKNVKL